MTLNAADGGWRPAAGPDVARLRARMLRRAREFFADRGVLEVDTPMLSAAAVTDVNIESVEARLALAPGRAHYLHTSPEFCMKRMLAAGFPDICSIGKVFRDGECGRRHQPEFTLVEWYRLGLSLDGMMRETADFITTVTAKFAGQPDFMSYADAFVHLVGIDPLSATVDELADAAGSDESLRESLGIDRDAWLDLLVATRLAPRFAPDRLTVLYHYPASQAALARLCPDHPETAERFEVYAGELELANGYVELADADEQRERIAADQQARRQRGLPLRPADDDFLAALDAGLPPCAGVAVGFDRLLMLAAGATDIRAVTHFPFEART